MDDIEFIFVDDCTLDASMDVLIDKINEYQPIFTQKSWIIIIKKMPVNGGLPAARRRGLMFATGDYILHCDSDDWIEPEMCSLMYETAKREKADIVVCDYHVSDGNKVIKTEKGCSTINKDVFIGSLLLQQDSWAVWNKLVRRDKCYKSGIVYPNGAMGEDMVLTLQLVLNCDTLAYVHKPLYNYFYNVDSMSRVVSVEKRERNFRQMKENVDVVLSLLDRNRLIDLYDNEVFYLKWRTKKLLWGIPKTKQRRRIWINTYREINHKVLFSALISIEEKSKFILSYIGLYPKKKY